MSFMFAPTEEKRVVILFLVKQFGDQIDILLFIYILSLKLQCDIAMC